MIINTQFHIFEKIVQMVGTSHDHNAGRLLVHVYLFVFIAATYECNTTCTGCIRGLYSLKRSLVRCWARPASAVRWGNAEKNVRP